MNSVLNADRAVEPDDVESSDARVLTAASPTVHSVDFEAARDLALALPSAHEEPHFDLVSFRVGTRIFATAPPDGEFIRIFVDESEARACVAEGLPGVALVRWGERVSGVSVVLASADADRLGELLEESWRRRAPKRMLERGHDRLPGFCVGTNPRNADVC